MNLRAVITLCLAAALSLSATAIAHGDTYTLSNSNNGDGYIVGAAPTFQLWGANNLRPGNYTTYTAIIAAPETVTFDWAYTTVDCCGSFYDPAGYVLNGVYTQLSTDSKVPLALDTSGTETLSLLAGDTFGFYVYSFDSALGRSELAVALSPASAATPEPGTLLLLGTGLLGFAGAARRRFLA